MLCYRKHYCTAVLQQHHCTAVYQKILLYCCITANTTVLICHRKHYCTAVLQKTLLYCFVTELIFYCCVTVNSTVLLCYRKHYFTAALQKTLNTRKKASSCSKGHLGKLGMCIFQRISKHRPSGPMLSLCRDVSLSIYFMSRFMLFFLRPLIGPQVT